ncbi:MAG: hypothetical protein QM778_31370 [Myxococcales bacterium]
MQDAPFFQSSSRAPDAVDRLLRSLFRRAVRRASWGLLLTAGCGGGGGFAPFPCKSSGDFDWQLEKMELARPVDYVALKITNEDASYQTSVAEHGVSCSGASDFDACRERLSEVERQLLAEMADSCVDEPDSVCFHSYYLLTTRGDDIQVWQSTRQIKEVLGSIDSPAEAKVYLATAEDDSFVYCSDADHLGFRTTSAGVEIRDLVVASTCRPVEEAQITRLVRPDGRVDVVARETYSTDPDACAVPGRRPEGLREPSLHGGPDAGQFFARAAYFEAASVPAFEKIVCELEVLGAPRELVQKARQAVRDEIQHAERMKTLATRFGAEVAPVEIREHPLRHAFELALDNAVEGCVHETFAALCATFQSEHARDPQVRWAMASLAEDETRHAGLSWQLAAWLLPQLSPSQRARIRQAQREALENLRNRVLKEESEELRALAGLPTRAQALTLVASLEFTLWGLRAA